MLNEHVRIVNGNSGEVVWFRKMRGCFKAPRRSLAASDASRGRRTWR